MSFSATSPKRTCTGRPNSAKIAAAIVVAMCLAGFAQASSVPIAFTGVIDFVEPGKPLSDNISVGMAFQGAYTYEYPATDHDIDPKYGYYQFPSSPLLVDIGGTSLIAPEHFVYVSNNAPQDRYGVGNLNPFTAAGVDWQVMWINLADESGTATNNDQLPTTAPDVQDYPDLNTFFLVQVGDRNPSIRGTITSMSLVPEPGTLLMLGLAAGAARRAARRTQP